MNIDMYEFEADLKMRAGMVYNDCTHIANVVQTLDQDGRSSWRVYDYDIDKKDAIEAYFTAMKGTAEVTFTRPF